MGISSYSTTPANNTALFPEGMPPSAVNDGMRQVQADIRSQCENNEWFNWGDTPSRASATTFKITGDVTTRYKTNRAIQCNDASTLYGIITAASYSSPDTTVTVNLDTGSLTASLTSVALAILSPTNKSIPTALGRKGADVASASTIDLSAAGGDFVDVTGTTIITAITSEAAGIQRTVRFTGALTLTHNATSLILPGGANITTANGDTALFKSLGSGNWLCMAYTKASGLPTVNKLPTVQKFTSGSGSYTTPTGCRWIKVKAVGGGGGGGGSCTSAGNNGGTGGAGGSTTFGSDITAGGGSGGNGTSSTLPGDGGTATLTTYTGIALDGGRGSPSNEGQAVLTTYQIDGGNGAASPFGGQGAGGKFGSAGNGGRTNTGAGGGGGGSPAGGISGKGGGAGAYIEVMIANPSATYSYAVGASGTAGSAGTSGAAGGAGGSGLIMVEEYY